MKKPSSSHWVLVADSGNARIFELGKEPAEFREVKKLVSASQHQTTRELKSDASGRDLRSQGPASHTLQPRSDAHDLGEQAFCRELVETLEQAASTHAFEHLVIIADPKTLGRLRQYMNKALAASVVKELGRDLVRQPQDKLEARVRAELGWTAG